MGCLLYLLRFFDYKFHVVGDRSYGSELVPGHAAPGRQVDLAARVVGHHAECLAGRKLGQGVDDEPD